MNTASDNRRLLVPVISLAAIVAATAVAVLVAIGFKVLA